jgi:hypothetical protein
VATTQTTEAHPIPLSPGHWRVDPARSELSFLTRIIFGLIAVRGRYSGFDGELHIDGAGFETKRLPRTVRIQAALTLDPTG